MSGYPDRAPHPFKGYDDTKEKTSKMNKDEKKEFVREKGWTEPTKYDYEDYTNGTFDNSKAIARALGLRDDINWASSSKRYEWDESYGDVGPKDPDLEKMLFGDPERQRPGKDLDVFQKLQVKVKSNGTVKPVLKWENAAIHPAMLDNIKLAHYKDPTPIQAYCLSAIHENLDVIGIAQTGSGKTAAFLVPILSKLMGKTKKLAAWRPCTSQGWDAKRDAVRGEPLVLVVCPTRELAMQIFDETRKFCYRTMLRPCVVYGGGPAVLQAEEISKGCDILIATPGRLQDFMRRPKLLSLARLKYTVLDEADELVHPDWADDLKNILHGGDNNRDADHRYMMFSATFNVHSRRLAKQLVAARHAVIQVGRPGSTHKHMEQICLYVDEDKKPQCLFDLLMSQPPARTLVFVNNKRTADEVDDFLFNHNLPSTSIHSDRKQIEREDAIRAFRYGSAPIMVATGVSARGLDFHNVPHIINYDLPSSQHGGIGEYVHRIGRTARIGNSGIATSFYNERNEDIAHELTKLFLECEQNIPSHLEQFKPEDGEKLVFEDEDEKSESSSEEEEDNDDADSDDSDSDSDDAKSVKGSDDGSTKSGEVNQLSDSFANLKVPSPPPTSTNDDADW